MFINVHNKIFTFDSKWNTRCKDSAKNRFSKEKENKLSFLSVRFLFQVQVPDPDPLTRSPQGGRNSFELFIYILFELVQ